MALIVSVVINITLLILCLWLFMRWANAEDRAEDAGDALHCLRQSVKASLEAEMMKSISEKARVVRKKDDDGLMFYDVADDGDR
jgi:uncharacterized protein YdeI (BOF family)